MSERPGLRWYQSALKRLFDLAVGVPLLVFTAPVIGLAAAIARLDTGASGIFRQVRVGKDGQLFEVRKVRTMRTSGSRFSTVTVSGDARVTRVGRILRALKIDELPQLINVIRGEMSLVGPRPDVPGYADALAGRDRLVLTVRPGITSPAALVYRHEEQLLARVKDPEAYNREVVWPDKVRINREYVENWSLRADLRCLLQTLSAVVRANQVNDGSVISR